MRRQNHNLTEGNQVQIFETSKNCPLMTTSTKSPFITIPLKIRRSRSSLLIWKRRTNQCWKTPLQVKNASFVFNALLKTSLTSRSATLVPLLSAPTQPPAHSKASSQKVTSIDVRRSNHTGQSPSSGSGSSSAHSHSPGDSWPGIHLEAFFKSFLA